MRRIMIVAGEASGDMHGAHLVAAMRALDPELSVCGMGGVELRRQGVDILYDAASLAVVGLVEVLAHLRDIRAARRVLLQELRANPPHLLILIDYPDFNLLLAGQAKKMGIPVFYYISPQVWAWRSGRVKRIGRLVDAMAVILPFEQQFYRQRGVDVHYVGHPLLDFVRRTMTREEFCRQHGINPGDTLLGLLPGSRKKEIRAMLPVFLQAAARLAATEQHLTVLLPLAPTLTVADLRECGLDGAPVDVRVIAENRYDLMAACDLAMAASGTVTLELAILDVPMVVAYRVSPLTWLAGKMLVKVEFASLVNLIAGREVVVELLQQEAEPERIAAALMDIRPGGKGREKMRHALAEVRKKLGRGGASGNAARLALATAR
jgi:lipid-A-disaccharide synthase